MAARAVELAEANGLLLAGERAHRHLGTRLFSSGDHSGARDHIQRGAELARQAGLTSSQIYILALLVRVYLNWGKFEEAGKTLSQLKLLLKDLSEPTKAASAVLIIELMYLGLRGQWMACAQQARALRASTRERGAERDQADAAYWLGWSILESRRLGTGPYAGEWQEAEAALAEATEIYDRSLSPMWGVITRALWGSLCIIQGRLADAHHLLAEANEKARVEPVLTWAEGRRQQLPAQVAAAEGHWTEAMDSFEAAGRSFASHGEPWASARVLVDRAEVHVSRGEPGDRQRAAELLREAQEAFQDMGVPRYAAIAQERLRELEISQA